MFSVFKKTESGYFENSPFLDIMVSLHNGIHIPTETLCDLLRMILTMNNCTFNQQHYLQIHGTAMGTKMAPSFANHFLCMFELTALTNAAWQSHIWWRYIDDIS